MSTIEVGDLLYEYTLKVTGLTEYGVTMASLMTGAAPPPGGARFDVAFAGDATAGKLTGAVTGVDYVRVRADGRFDLHIHAELTTADGCKIALHAGGVALPRPGSPVFDLREHATLYTASAGYAWVNPLQVWAIGTVDMAQQVIHVRGYVA